MAEVVEVVSILVLSFWLLLMADRRRWWPGDLRLGKPPVDERAAVCDRVVVVIPARNEAAQLERSLPPLVAQSQVFERLIVVDDGSSDGTAEVTRRIAANVLPQAASEKVVVLEAPPPPPGWSGKLHALETGVESARQGARPPGWFLFTDADILHREDSILALLWKARRGNFDLVSIMAKLRASTFWEKLLIPPFVYFFQLLYPFRRVADPRSRVAAAAGGCVLVSRSRLEQIGGLASMRGALIDDVTLASRVKRSGGRCWLGLDASIRSLRGYETLSEIVHMVARTAFTQLAHSYLLLLLTLFLLGVFFVAPPLLIVVGTVGPALAAVCGCAVWGLQTLSLLPVVRHQGVAAGYALLLPLAAALYAYMTAYSAWRYCRSGRTQWKGRAFEP